MDHPTTKDYEVSIRWSEEDQLFVANIVEMPGVMAHGATREEAAREIDVALENTIDHAREIGAVLPEPRRAAAV